MIITILSFQHFCFRFVVSLRASRTETLNVILESVISKGNIFRVSFTEKRSMERDQWHRRKTVSSCHLESAIFQEGRSMVLSRILAPPSAATTFSSLSFRSTMAENFVERFVPSSMMIEHIRARLDFERCRTRCKFISLSNTFGKT